MELIRGTPALSLLQSPKNSLPTVCTSLSKKKFSGYLALAIRAETGFEEGALLYDSGKIVACSYSYFLESSTKTFDSKDAFQRVVNASAAKNGVIDAFELCKEDVHSIISASPQSVFAAPASFTQPKEFSQLFYQQSIGFQMQENEGGQSFFKKFKIKNL